MMMKQIFAYKGFVFRFVFHIIEIEKMKQTILLILFVDQFLSQTEFLKQFQATLNISGIAA
jgi:hypothetical protein